MQKALLFLAFGISLVGCISITNAVDEKIEYVPWWYRADHQPNENVQFPDGAKIMKAKGTTNHQTGLKVENPNPTHTENMPQEIDLEALTTSEIVNIKKQSEAERAMEIMRALGYVK